MLSSKPKLLFYSLATMLVASGCSGGANTASLPAADAPQSVTMNADPATQSTTAFGASSVRGAASIVPGYQSAVMSDAPLAYYHLNDLGSVMLDAGPNHLNGTIGSGVAHGGPVLTTTNDPSPTFAGGAYNTALFASAPVNAAFQPANAVSVEAWIKPAVDNLNGFIPLVAYGKASEGAAYLLEITPQNVVQFYAHTSASNGIHLEGGTLMHAGITHHVVATYDGATASLYVDGHLDRSTPASGTLQYKYLNSADGFSIGGALDRSPQNFAGNISEVAVYGRALSASDVQAHYVSGNVPLTLTEHPHATNSLIDSMGVNTHFSFTNTNYTNNYPQLKQLLIGLGVRHIRDGLHADSVFARKLNELGSYGIHGTFVTAFGMSADTITSFPSLAGPMFEAYEAPNEPDVNPVGDWVTNTRNFQQFLFTTVKSNAATQRFRVLGPTPTNIQDFLALGDLSKYMDNGNFHSYTAGFNPGNDGYGANTVYGKNGSLNAAMNVARIVAGNNPLMLTETGWNQAGGTNRGHTPPDVTAKYLPRMFFEAFNRNVKRTFVYQLCDFENSSYFQDGLLDQNLNPKPAYNAMKNLIAILRDPHPPTGANGTTNLTYTLSGNLARVHHTLMQRGDGGYDLALWIEASSMVPTVNSAQITRINVVPQTVNVVLPTLPKTMTVKTLDAAGNVSTTVPQSIGISTQVSVGDTISIVHFAL